MKKKIIGLLFGSLALSLGALLGATSFNKEIKEASAYYSPSTHYEVSDTASELASYYSSISDSDTGTSLLSKLQSLNSSKRKRTIGYSGIGTDLGGAVIYTDYDLNNTAKDSNGQTYGTKVASFYTKTSATGWNREHMWPNSHGGNNVEADILHTRPTISSENSSRGNSFYVEGKNSSSAGWDPFTAGYDAEVRGECARVILYCVVAYPSFTLSDADSHSTSNSNKDNMMGNMNTLIKWHFDYAPNVYEMNRNNGAEYLQGNRNPFVDHPEYVAKIWSNFNSTVSSLCTSNASKYSGWTPGNYCNYGSNTPITPNVGVTISSSSASISVGSSTTLSATASNSGTISWTTSNSSVASISSSSSASGANITVTGVSAGTATITARATIGGTQYSSTCTVTVTKVVSSLSKGSTSPTKTTYTAGESFDPTGLTITANYTDSTSSNVTSSVVWTPNPLTEGTTSVTGTFGGKTIVISGLTVNAATEPEIIDSNSDLSVGNYVYLRTAAGVGVTGWNNNKDATVSETESQWKRYYVASASSSGFTLKDETANSFIATPGSDNKFVYGSAATCSTDSSGHLICNSRYLCKNGTNYRFYSSISSYLPFFIYKVPGSSSTKTLSSIAVSTAPSKTTYTAGETFDPTGLVITRNYSDSTSDTYTYSGHTSEFTFSPTTSTALTTSNTSVTITYGSKSCNQAITVNAAAVKTLSSISISGQKTSFTLDESFYFGGTVTAHYSDSTSADVTSNATFTGYNMSVAGNYTVTVSYTYSGTTKTTTYDITVNASGGSGGGGESDSFSGTYNYGNQGTGTGKTWSLTDCSDQSSYWLCPSSGSESIATIPGIFTNKTITSSVVITINSGTYGSGTNPSESTFKIYNSSACSTQVTATQTGTLPTSKTYTDAIYTVSMVSASDFSDDLAIKITKPGKQIRLVSINVEFDYTVSGSSQEDPTSIVASVLNDRIFYVGETITKSDILVKTNTNVTVTSQIEFSDYQFKYSDASSGGATTNKIFNISYESLNTTLIVKVQRKAYASPSTSSLTHTGSEFSSSGIGSSFATGQVATVDGIMFLVDGYIYSSKLSLSDSKTSATGKVINTTPYSKGITNVTVSGASPDIQLSVDGEDWVDLSNATTSTQNYYYLKIFYKTTAQSNFVNITQIDVTIKGSETALNVANYVMYEDTNNQCSSKLPIALAYLNSCSSTELSAFESSSDYVIATARERLEAWATNQGKTIDYTAGEVTLKNAHFESFDSIMNSSNNILIVVIVTSIGLVVIGSCFLFRKRKEK